MPEHAFQNLVQVVDRLHRRDGCPWDRALKLKDLRKYILEEAHEVIEAINDNDLAKLKDELGDLLFQVLTGAKLADKKKSFRIEDVLINTKKKMLRRHPHVFGNTRIRHMNDILDNWERIKKDELKNSKDKRAPSIPETLPALAKAELVQKRMSTKDPDPERILNTIKRDLSVLGKEKHSKGSKTLEKTIGRTLFNTVTLARLNKINAECALESFNQSEIKKRRKK